MPEKDQSQRSVFPCLQLQSSQFHSIAENNVSSKMRPSDPAAWWSGGGAGV
jgi:hypothetical protein